MPKETEDGAPRFLSLALPPLMALVLKDVRVQSAWDSVTLRGLLQGLCPRGAKEGPPALLPRGEGDLGVRVPMVSFCPSWGDSLSPRPPVPLLVAADGGTLGSP